MLEKMGEFFDRRLDGYDEHQLTCIESAREFYPYTAGTLPAQPGARILDLGCGTGLELKEYYLLNPAAKITGVDLAPGMLNVLRERFRNKNVTLILGSYFEVPFGTSIFDAAVSVESLHHFTKEEKTDEFYHYDTPLTVEHEKEALIVAGFSSVEVLKQWGATYTLKANREIPVLR